MERLLTFKQMYFDTIELGNQQNYEFFKDSDEISSSITELSEDESISWIFNIPYFRNYFIEEFIERPNNYFIKTNIGEPITQRNKKPGDIDILILDKERPDLSVAFEVKRVKIITQLDGKHKLNNVTSIQKGVRQVNGYQSIGFHKSYLMVVMLDDSRLADYPNSMMRNSQSSLIDEIYDIPWNEELHEDVGIVYLKITQPTNKSYNKMAGLGFCIDKSANKLQQSEVLTNKIRELIKVSS